MQPTTGSGETPAKDHGRPALAVALAGPGRAPRNVPAFSWRALLLALGLELLAFSAAGLVRGLLAHQLGMRLATAEIIAVCASLVLAIAAGWCAARFSRRVGFWELVLGALAVVGAGYGLLLLSTEGAAAVFALVPEAAIWFGPLIAGASILLVSCIAATVGYMLGAGTALDLSFGYEAYVAKSHLRLSRSLLVGLSLLTVGLLPGAAALYLLLRKQKRSPTLIMTVLSIGGVAVGVMALCVVMSVMSGFEQDLKAKILGTNAHAIVMKYGSFEDWPKTAEITRETAGVVGVTPFVLNEVMVSTESNLAGALIKGIDPATVGEVTELPNEITEGDLAWLATPEKIPTTPQFRAPEPGANVAPQQQIDELQAEIERLAAAGKHQQAAQDQAAETNQLPGIVIGRELARQLRVFVGDQLTVVSPIAGELGPMGPQPKSMQFRLAGVFYSGMYEYDSKFVYISLDRAQSFFKMGKGITGLEMKVTDIDDARRISRQVLSKLEGYPYRVKDWGEMNKNLFSALKLEKLVMAVILAFIILVACFNILSTLVMVVLEKGKEISILKSMGARDSSVMKIFVLEGLAIGGIGTALGLVLGFVLCATIAIFPIPLDPEVYYIPNLPVDIDLVQFGLVAIGAVVLAYLATILPALYAARLPPVEGLRND